MTSSVTGHQWSAESLFCKAQLYVERMETHTADDWQFGFWSTLTLEILARAALAHISPVLLAQENNWRHLYYALTGNHITTKYIPRSVATGKVLSRLKELVPNFNDEIYSFCVQHAERRNAELHSGDLPFEVLETSEWISKFYVACNVLLESMNRTLSDLVSNVEDVHELIRELSDDTSTAVRDDIMAHKTVWFNKDKHDQDEASRRATTWATRHKGHRVECPACKSPAVVQGTPTGPVTTELDGDELIQRQAMLPSIFECTACGLKISGISKLMAVGLGNAFRGKYTYTAAEFFGLFTEDELEEARIEGLEHEYEYEPDFNEY